MTRPPQSHLHAQVAWDDCPDLRDPSRHTTSSFPKRLLTRLKRFSILALLNLLEAQPQLLVLPARRRSSRADHSLPQAQRTSQADRGAAASLPLTVRSPNRSPVKSLALFISPPLHLGTVVGKVSPTSEYT